MKILQIENSQIIESLNNQNVSVSNIRIKNPNNPISVDDLELLVFGV